MKTEKTMKTKSLTATKTPAATKAGDSLETTQIRKRSVKVAAPEPATMQSQQPTRSLSSSPQEISTDLIAQRAYIIWEQQGRPQGRDLANWLLAESQLKQEQSFSAWQRRATNFDIRKVTIGNSGLAEEHSPP